MDITVTTGETGRYKAVTATGFKILFRCASCSKETEPDYIIIGREHIYCSHCGNLQSVGCMFRTGDIDV